MSMCRGNEGGSVWVCFFPNIFHKFLPLFELPSKYCGLQSYLCKQKGPFNLFSVICGIAPERDNQVWSLQCKHHLLSSRALQGHLCTKICFLQQWCAPQTRLQERSWRGRSFSWKASAEITPAIGTLPHHWIDLCITCLLVPNPIRRSLGMLTPGGAGGEGKLMSNKGKERSGYRVRMRLKIMFLSHFKKFSSSKVPEVYQGSHKTRTEAGTSWRSWSLLEELWGEPSPAASFLLTLSFQPLLTSLTTKGLFLQQEVHRNRSSLSITHRENKPRKEIGGSLPLEAKSTSAFY